MEAEGLKIIYSPDEVAAMVKRLAGEIDDDYAGRRPVLVGALKGAFVFLSDLVRTMDSDPDVDFIQASSYGVAGATPTGVVITRDVTMDLDGRDVVIVDGIVDRGKTVEAVTERLVEAGASTVKVCALLERNLREGVRHRADYVGARLDGGFVVGYGMDYKERYRGLAGVYLLEDA